MPEARAQSWQRVAALLWQPAPVQPSPLATLPPAHPTAVKVHDMAQLAMLHPAGGGGGVFWAVSAQACRLGHSFMTFSHAKIK